MREFLSRHRTALLLLSTLLYDASPVDLVPDLLPVFGLLDDLGITGVAIVVALTWWRQRRAAALAAPAR